MASSHPYAASRESKKSRELISTFGLPCPPKCAAPQDNKSFFDHMDSIEKALEEEDAGKLPKTLEAGPEIIVESLNKKRRRVQTTEAPVVVAPHPHPASSSPPSSPPSAQPLGPFPSISPDTLPVSEKAPENNEATASQPPTKKARLQKETEHHSTKPRPSSPIRRSSRLASIRRRSSSYAGHAIGNAAELPPLPLSPSISQQMTTDTTDGQTPTMQAGPEIVVESLNKERRHSQITETPPVVVPQLPPVVAPQLPPVVAPQFPPVVAPHPHPVSSSSLSSSSSTQPLDSFSSVSPDTLPVSEKAPESNEVAASQPKLSPLKLSRVHAWEMFYQEDDEKKLQDRLSGRTLPPPLCPSIPHPHAASSPSLSSSSSAQPPDSFSSVSPDTLPVSQKAPESNEVTASQPPTKNVRFREEIEYRFIESRPLPSIQGSSRLASVRHRSSSRAGHAIGNVAELSPPMSSRIFTPGMLCPEDDEKNFQDWMSGRAPPPPLPPSISRILMKRKKTQETEPLADSQTSNARNQGSQVRVGESDGASNSNNKDIIGIAPISDTASFAKPNATPNTNHTPKPLTRLPIQLWLSDDNRLELTPKMKIELAHESRCFRCKEVGHWVNRCPQPKPKPKDDEVLLQIINSEKSKGKRRKILYQCQPPHVVGKNEEPKYNRAFLEQLKILMDHYENIKTKDSKEHFKVINYRKAITAIRSLDYGITSEEMALKVPRVGKKIAQKIGECIALGKIKKLEHINWDKERSEVETLFQSVHGVGSEKATE
ncbi:hypothetical protein BGZ80_003330, partial [Entomortierella chlamydospora]